MKRPGYDGQATSLFVVTSLDVAVASSESGRVHRVFEVAWLPRSPVQWETFTLARRAAGDLWSAMATRHARIRRLNWAWPSKARWEKWARGRFPGLSAQSVQQTVGEFCECLAATTAARKALRAAGEAVVVAVGSGRYAFEVRE